MSLSPTKILQRLQDLKIWQEQQEALLQKKSIPENVETNIDTTDWENKPLSPAKTFEQLLEEKLAKDLQPQKIAQIIKRPFLRKGTGLKRFRMNEKKTKLGNFVRKTEDFKPTPLRVPEFSIKSKATWRKINENIDETPPPKLDKLETDDTYEKALEKELLIFETLEKRANNSSFCSTNSSIVQLFANTPNKPRTESHLMPTIEEYFTDRTEEQTSVSKQIRDDCSANMSTSITSSITSDDLDDFTNYKDTGTNTCNEICAECGNALQEKIMEYEKEINNILEEKNKLILINRTFERKKADLDRLEQKLRIEIEEEKCDILAELEAERQKLEKAKTIHNSGTKEAQNQPNRKIREELTNLRKELADTKELLKLKETKNGAVQARLRNQIKQLEKDNQRLKDEQEKLIRENAKLAASQKFNRRPSDSKLLQEINKTLTKLTQETRKIEKKSGSSSDETDKSDGAHRKKSTSNEKNAADKSTTASSNGEKCDELILERPPKTPSVPDNPRKNSDRSERILDDGTREIRYSNGNIKTITSDGNLIIVKYYNNDIKQTNLSEGCVKYFYADKNIWHTNLSNGSEMIEFPNGLVEKKFQDEHRELVHPDGVVQTIYPDGAEEIKYTDGSVATIKHGTTILQFPNGQREIHTKNDKRREYPDGTLKILYPDGTQETKYANGRIRIKDPNGILIMDSYKT